MSQLGRPLEGRVALVTGGSRGIGRAIAERFGAEGATVVIGARSIDASSSMPGTANETVAQIEQSGGKAIALHLDLNDAESRRSFVEQAIAKAGPVDILVNNAGTAIYAETDQLTLEQTVSQTMTYFLGPVDLCRQIIPHMKAHQQGWIVNLGSSTAGSKYDQFVTRYGDDTLYAALKSAMHRFSRGLAAELHPHNIAVNVVAPVGAILTPGLESVSATQSNLEPVEHLVEAALDLVSRDPGEWTAKLAYSFRYLEKIGRSTMTLDGGSIFTERSPIAVD